MKASNLLAVTLLGGLVFTAGKGCHKKISTNLENRDSTVATRYGENIARLKGQLTVDEFGTLDSVTRALPGKNGYDQTPHIKAIQKAASELTGISRDSVPNALNKFLANLPKAKL